MPTSSRSLKGGIQGALAAGFSLAELTRNLKLRDAGRSPCRKVRQLLADKLSGLDIRTNYIRVRDHRPRRLHPESLKEP
ncbi:MAG: MerR family DNA-binding protein [Acidobacteria bacterium]|nr:MerR family DNA-binding protein [Acidobacteriota bacterium]